jgi:hypothetical protein
MPTDRPTTPPATGRRPAAIALALLVFTLALTLTLTVSGCGREEDLIGTGPIRSVSAGADGTAYVLRAWRDRTPNAAVLLVVDPLTGSAAPILPKLGGHRGAAIREIEFVVPRPAAADPPELVIGGPEIGIAVIRGPFAYLGAYPEVEIRHEGRFLPPAAGPAAAASPDGRHLLMFEPARDAEAAAGTTSWRVVLVDLATLELTRLGGRVASRDGQWLSGDRFRLGRPGRIGRVGEDGTIALTDAAPDPAGGEANGDANGDGRLARAAALVAALPEANAEPVEGYCRWPAAGERAPDTPPLHGIAWTAHALFRLTGPLGGEPDTAVPLPLGFDRGG